jgi:hypothetical protein
MVRLFLPSIILARLRHTLRQQMASCTVFLMTHLLQEAERPQPSGALVEWTQFIVSPDLFIKKLAVSLLPMSSAAAELQKIIFRSKSTMSTGFGTVLSG